MLWSLGCQVLWAADQCEALALCAQHVPDLAVLNFCQPDGTDGIGFACVLQTNFHIKVFFVTGARQQDLKTSLNFNADHTVLYKPFTQRQFKAALTHYA